MTLGLLLRLAAAASAALWFDEATVGLMAVNVLKGEFPWFFYGQSFMGAAEAYLHAAIFAPRGSSVLALRIWPLLASLLHVALTGLLGRRIFGDGRWAVLFALLPSPFLLKWGHDARLHYDLVLVFTPLSLLLGLRTLDASATPPRRTRAFLVFAFLAGIGWWINPLLGLLPVALTPVFLPHWPRLHRAAWSAPVACLLGSAPFWLFSVAQGRLAVSAIPPVSGAMLREHVTALATNALPILMGLPAAFPLGTLKALLSGGAVALFLTAATVSLSDRRAALTGRLLLAALLAVSLLGVAATGHGRNLATEDPRYLLPLLAVVPVLLGGLAVQLRRAAPLAAGGLVVLVLALHGLGLWTEYPFLFSRETWGTRQLAVAGPDAQLVFLVSRGISALYTHDPDILTFASRERIAVSHFYLESYPPLARRVDGAPRVGYFSTDPPPSFEASLTAAGIHFTRQPSPLGLLYTDFALEEANYREIPPDGWTATASHNSEAAAHAFDRDAATRWESQLPARTGMWFQVDLGRRHPVGMVTWLPGSFQEVPAGFRLEASPDGRGWTTLREVAPYYGPLYWSGDHPMGRVRWGRVELRFPAVSARYLRLSYLGESRRFRWTIRELFAYEASGSRGPGPPPDPAAAAEALRQAGIRKVYADHGVGAQLAEAANGALAIQPANLRVDAYGKSSHPNVLPEFRALHDAAIVYPSALPSTDSIPAMLQRAGWRFTVTGVVGYRILSRFAPAAPPGTLLAARNWTISAFPERTDPRAVLDGQPNTRWTTGEPQRPGAWLRVDLGSPVRITGLTLHLGPFRTDYPRGLAVEISPDGIRWERVSAEVMLQGPLAWAGTHLLRDGVDGVLVSFGPVQVRALRMVQTGRDPVFDWSVAELYLYGS